MKRRKISLLATAVVASLAVSPAVAVAAETPPLSVDHLTVDRIVEPLGIDEAQPMLGWRIDAVRPGTSQSAYEVEVFERGDTSPVWDTDKVASTRSFDVAYEGEALRSQTQYEWRVRVWDDADLASDWSELAPFETAFVDEADFGGDWIGSPNRAPDVPLTGANWIWSPETDPTSTVAPGTRYFRTQVEIPAGADVTSAQIQMTADDSFTLYVNGAEVISSPAIGDAWRMVQVTDIAAHLHGGTNTIAVEAVNGGGPFGIGGAAGLLAKLHVTTAGGQTIDMHTDDTWLVTDVRESGWETESFDASSWSTARIGAAYGSGPWGNGASAPVPAEPLLRRDFDVTKNVESARVYVSGLGYYKLYVNGERVGNHELDPGFTVYDKTTLYATYDVTDAIAAGENALGVSLGRGYFGQAQPDDWASSAWHDDTKLKLELEITYEDGTTKTVVSDRDWTTTDGPTTSESMWFGESYDARRLPADWNTAGFDDSAWQPAVRVDGPGGELRSQLFPAIEVTEDLPVVAVTEPTPGTFVYDFGRPTAGWANIAVEGPAGAQVQMRYGEKLHENGTVNNDNVYFTIQNYSYILNGEGTERYQPSYSYAGFRYLQVTVPDGVQVTDVKGMRVHTAVDRVGDFSSGNDLLNKYNAAQADTILNNLHSIPTDTPMYEKRAYGADAFLTSDSAIALFDMHGFYDNWMRTHRDDQSADGTFGNTVPGSVGAKNVTDPVWTTSYVAISWDMYQYYGDAGVLESNYDGLARWMDHYDADIAATGDIYTGFSYGDWLSPAGASPPEGTRLLATAYLYEGALTMQKIATVLGEDADAARYGDLAVRIYDAFNATFFNDAESAYFDDAAAGYRQTSNLVPLKFGLVPEELRERVLNRLVQDIEDREDHLNTGAIGTKDLLPLLAETGHADLAYRVATNPTYPGWGFWFGELGATTMWEEWGAQSRSHNHTFLGTVVDWMYQDVAGIEPTGPGYTGIKIQPYPIAGLDTASANVDSPLGQVASTWTRTDDAYTLDVTVPVGATAEVHVPVREGEAVTVTPDLATAVSSSAAAPGFAVFTVGSGEYRFVAQQAEEPGTGEPGSGDAGANAGGSDGSDGSAGGDGDLAVTGGTLSLIAVMVGLGLLLVGAAFLVSRRLRSRN